ncbi:hypothetical protein K431DRAFT_285197 [Polychaeton citri CBS 116435]|uniref:NUDE domain-containing protein n=1 Tax=Polychaeton citri CBS 116435 TaxID=1314669 RepID=A0A9P4Q5W6_9PEZI|nr:hypothetical protein K431DRAFT_285197 [Polychaeton citri CBS 116435]
MTSSPLRLGASLEEELDYYKRQYEQLEQDLADFQSSSKDLEAQLEADIEAAEKNERKLKAENEKLRFEADEWKAKNKSAREESNRSQNVLQREITTLRDEKRGLELRLRDVEVVNDDYERQARNTEVSLEDLEGKYNSAIEKGVMLEEEVKLGEQEREELRIASQRLRDELGDLRVESEITLEKLRLAEQTAERLRSQRKPSALAVDNLRIASPEVASEASAVTQPSPTASTPPPKSDSASEAPTPPSPPLSDVPNGVKRDPQTPTLERKRRSLILDASATPRPSGVHGSRAMTAARHARGPSANSVSTQDSARLRASRLSAVRSHPHNATPPDSGLPRSESLYHVRNLRSRMQKIEERVHAARSKHLPASSQRSRGSPLVSATSTPRNGSALSGQIPSSVTLRRASKRPSMSRTESYATSIAEGDSSSVTREGDGPVGTPASNSSVSAARRSSHVKRLSFGIPRPTSAMDRAPSALERPSSRTMERPPSALDRPPSVLDSMGSRPSSRQSLAGPNGRNSALGNRASRSSIGNGFATVHATPRRTLHRPSASVSELRYRAVADGAAAATAAAAAATGASPASPTYSRQGTALPGSSGSALPTKRDSIGGGSSQPNTTAAGPPAGRTVKMRASTTSMGPPPARRKTLQRTTQELKPQRHTRDASEDLGETY